MVNHYQWSISTILYPNVSLIFQVTMPPCKRCFMLLVASGVKRIVTRKQMLQQEAKDDDGTRREAQPLERKIWFFNGFNGAMNTKQYGDKMGIQ